MPVNSRLQLHGDESMSELLNAVHCVVLASCYSALAVVVTQAASAIRSHTGNN